MNGKPLAVAVIAGTLLVHPRPAASQSLAQPMRGDVTGVIAWQLAESDPERSYDRWHSSFFGGAGTGWYWTSHLKTEVDFGASTTSEVYGSQTVVVDGRQTYRPSHRSFSRRTLGISQQYQFFENAWFHPHLAAGVNVTWERRIEAFDPAVLFSGPRIGEVVIPASVEGPTILRDLRPFVATGFKAYVTPKSFFRMDLRLAFRGGVDESHVRMGFGVDF